MELIIAIIVIIAAFIIKAIYDKKKYYEKTLAQLQKAWGKIPTQEYTSEEFKSLTKYYRSVKDINHDIDDITWNDVDMDEIFMLMNNTGSAIGEEYLYSILRKVKFNKEELEERNRLIEFFSKQPEQRLKLQMALKYIGKLKNISVYEYINRLDHVEEKSNLPHIIMIGGLLSSIILIPFSPALGAILTVGFVTNNIIQYYRRKAQIEIYFSVCNYVVRLLTQSKDIIKLDLPEIKPYAEQLNKSIKSFSGFMKGSKMLGGKNPNGDLVDVLADYVKMLFHFDLMKFNSMLSVFKKNKASLNELFQTIGLLDSMIAVASFREMLEYYSIPELMNSSKPYLLVEELYHPMIEKPVTNSIKEDRCVVITGSNASGKSTFIKTLAINAILSQTIYTSLSKKYNASFFQIASSMALQDNIFSNESYYIVEIKSLKRILDRLDKDIPTLCFVDEVLRGTNTLERIAASSQILYSFSNINAMCFAATHDIELTYILEKHFSNYHFQEEVVVNKVLFDYKLYEGRAESRNAIKLLGMMGYPEAVIEDATNSANLFLKEGFWKEIQ
jgi:DNA mismatch repair ATPase MutS